MHAGAPFLQLRYIGPVTTMVTTAGTCDPPADNARATVSKPRLGATYGRYLNVIISVFASFNN